MLLRDVSEIFIFIVNLLNNLFVTRLLFSCSFNNSVVGTDRRHCAIVTSTFISSVKSFEIWNFSQL